MITDRPTLDDTNLSAMTQHGSATSAEQLGTRMAQYEVRPIKAKETHDWLLRIHYARRLPPISYAFGLYADTELVGVVTYGYPSSAPLKRGVAGPNNAHLVVELNRLCFAKPVQNGPSMLVGRSLRMLPSPLIVVSFADTEQGHVGYVYQACNFLYTGLSAKRKNWKIRGQEHLHSHTIADISRSAAGGERGSRVQFMKEKFGDDFYLEDRSRKHRYVYLNGTYRQRRELEAQLLYPREPYPKGDTRRYAIDAEPSVQQILI